MGAIAGSSVVDGKVRLPSASFQPIASDDVGAAVADAAHAAPRNGTIEIVARYLKAIGDPREVVSDPKASYFARTRKKNVLI